MLAAASITQVMSQDSKPATNTASELKLETLDQKAAYIIGTSIGCQVGQIDISAMAAGIKDSAAGAKLRFTDEEMQQIMSEYQEAAMAKKNPEAAKAAADNAAAEKAFLEKNGKEEGVKTTASGLQYKVLKEGSGDKPTAQNEVKVHYHGTLLDGTVFDSSVQRGEPAQFPVGGVIPGWIEALQLMNPGSKYKLFIPAKLAYGNRQMGDKIKPGSTLIFEVELLEIVK